MFGKITAMFMATIISITPMAVQATALPLPYVPPTEVHIIDFLHNAYGLTAPQIQDDAKRLAAYYELYRRVLGASYENFYNDMQAMIRKAKTSRKMEIGASLNTGLQSVLKSAVQNGYTYTESDEPVTPPTDAATLKQWFANYGYTNIDTIANTLSNLNYSNKVYAIIRGAADANGNQKVMFMAVQKKSNNWICEPFYSNTWVYQGGNGNPYAGTAYWGIYNIPNQIFTKTSNASTDNGYIFATNWVVTGEPQILLSDDIGETTEVITAQSQGIIDALINGVDLILTAHSQVVDGSVDDTKPIVIDLPITLPVPAVTVADLPAVQDELGVLPLPMTEDPAETVSEMQATQAAELGTTGDYQLDLTELFPFCIPFDIARVIGLFVAEPQTPVFQFAFPIGYEDGAFIMQTFEMDLAALDGVAVWVRRGMLAVFVVGLGMVTRQVFLRG